MKTIKEIKNQANDIFDKCLEKTPVIHPENRRQKFASDLIESHYTILLKRLEKLENIIKEYNKIIWEKP